MANSVEMPELGESVTEGTITQWLKSVGDTVEVDEPLLEVSTDKVDTEIPSPVAGTIIEIKADEDDTIEVGEVIAIIGDEDEAGSASNDSSADKDEEEAEEAHQDGVDLLEEAGCWHSAGLASTSRACADTTTGRSGRDLSKRETLCAG